MPRGGRWHRVGESATSASDRASGLGRFVNQPPRATQSFACGAAAVNPIGPILDRRKAGPVGDAVVRRTFIQECIVTVQQIVEAGSKQAQETWSAAVERLGAVADPKAALARAREESARLGVVLRHLPTVAKVRDGVGSVIEGAARGLVAVSDFGKSAAADAVRAATELKESASRVVASPPADASAGKQQQ
jgi:hypothetical protein